MDLTSSQAFFWLSFAVSIFAVAAFLCWCLFEIARLLRQSNEVVEHTRDVVSGIEEDVGHAREKLGGVLGNLSGIAAATKGLASFAGSMRQDDEKPAAKHAKRRFNKLLNEEEETEE